MRVLTRKRRTGSAEEIISDLRRVAELLSKDTVSQDDYITNGVYSVNTAAKLTGNWNETLRKAGLRVSHQNWNGGAFLKGLEEVAGRVGRVPTYDEYKGLATSMGHPCVSAIEKRFGSWTAALEALEAKAAALSSSGVPVVLVPTDKEELRNQQFVQPRGYGDPTGFDQMIFAPTSENQVLVLFGMLARELGIVVKNVRARFPDCAALRRDRRTGLLVDVTIEFELKSSGFKQHKHPHDEHCLLICWLHDWKDFPSTLEIISLKECLERRGIRLRKGQAI